VTPGVADGRADGLDPGAGEPLAPGDDEAPGLVPGEAFGLRVGLGEREGLADAEGDPKPVAIPLPDGVASWMPEPPGRRRTTAMTASTITASTTASPWLTRRQSWSVTRQPRRARAAR
jgi:hypothetical protein